MAATETVEVSREEYENLKEMADVDWELVQKLKRSFEDIKHGRFLEITFRKNTHSTL